MLIHKDVIKALRSYHDLSVSIKGIPCTLFIPKDTAVLETQDAYGSSDMLSFDSYETTVIVDWSPNKYRMAKSGIYMEDDIPIIAYLPNKVKNESGFEINLNIVPRSYLDIPIEYAPHVHGTNQFEIIDVLVPKMYNAIIQQVYKLAPKRTI